MTLQSLNLSRVFKCDAKTLFAAIEKGVLFEKTGAASAMEQGRVY